MQEGEGFISSFEIVANRESEICAAAACESAYDLAMLGLSPNGSQRTDFVRHPFTAARKVGTKLEKRRLSRHAVLQYQKSIEQNLSQANAYYQ